MLPAGSAWAASSPSPPWFRTGALRHWAILARAAALRFFASWMAFRDAAAMAAGESRCEAVDAWRVKSIGEHSQSLSYNSKFVTLWAQKAGLTAPEYKPWTCQYALVAATRDPAPAARLLETYRPLANIYS